MCTRIALHKDADIIRRSLLDSNGIRIEAWDDSNEFQPRYNIGDKMRVPVVFYRAARRNMFKTSPEDDTPAAFIMRSSRWRIVPDFCIVEDERSKNLEVSAENLVNNMGFGKIARNQTRCAVVCQGWVGVQFVGLWARADLGLGTTHSQACRRSFPRTFGGKTGS